MFLKFKKISFLCYNISDWENAEDLLFRMGYEWESYGKEHIYCEYQFPRVIQNFRTGDIFGGKYLIMIDYDFHKRFNTIHKLTNLTKFRTYTRKEKLKNLKKKNFQNNIKNNLKNILYGIK